LATDRTISAPDGPLFATKEGNSITDKGSFFLELVLSFTNKGISMNKKALSALQKGFSVSKESLSVMEKVKSLMELVLFVTNKGFSMNNECPFMAEKGPSIHEFLTSSYLTPSPSPIRLERWHELLAGERGSATPTNV
jgi:hypothetical protein